MLNDLQVFLIVFSVAHQHFVGALGFSNQVGLVSGSNDKTALVWRLTEFLASPSADTLPKEPTLTLIGHTASVSCVAVSETSSVVVTGSWDCSLRVWLEGACLHVLSGHTASIWGITFLPSGQVASVGADKSIRLWEVESGQSAGVMLGHGDAVRDIALLPSHDHLATVSNDGSCRLWSLANKTALVSEQISSTFLYTLTLLQDALICGGEDHLARIYPLPLCGRPLQQIMLPGVIWSVTTLPTTADLVIGCSDGKVYVFTREESRKAGIDELNSLEASLQASTLTTNEVAPGMKLESLPSVEELQQSVGKTHGDVAVARNGQVGQAFQWDATQQQWMLIGEVTGGGNEKKPSQVEFEGKMWDYVIDVDTGDGIMRQLPHNLSDNPYLSAERFVTRHELSAEFIPQIVEFIGKHTETPMLETSAADPLTGRQRYVAGEGNTTTTTAPPLTFLANRHYVTFTQVNIAGLTKAVHTQMAADPTLIAGEDAQDLVSAWIGAVTAEGTVSCPTHQLGQISRKLCNNASDAALVPFLDLIRLSACIDGLEGVAGHSDILQPLIERRQLHIGASWPLRLLSLRYLANLFTTRGGRTTIALHYELLQRVLTDTMNSLKTSNPSPEGKEKDKYEKIKLCYASLAWNLSIFLCYETSEVSWDVREGYRLDLMFLAVEGLQYVVQDSESTFALLMSISNLLANDEAVVHTAVKANLDMSLRLLRITAASQKVSDLLNRLVTVLEMKRQAFNKT
jgi:WD40 repeat protein